MLRTVSMLAACFGCCCCCWSRRFTRANALLCGIETICMYALTILSIFKIANECVNNTRDSLCIDDVWFQSCIYMSDEPAVLLSLYLSAGLVSLSLSVISVFFFGIYYEFIRCFAAALHSQFGEKQHALAYTHPLKWLQNMLNVFFHWLFVFNTQFCSNTVCMYFAWILRFDFVEWQAMQTHWKYPYFTYKHSC